VGSVSKPNERRVRRWHSWHWIVMMATFLFATILFATLGARAADKIERSLYAAPCSCEVKRAGMLRAGMPWCHFPWARRQVECDYVGYYVGGGAPGSFSRGRRDDEGTWGWDYTGRHFRPKVGLCWTCPPRQQGGTGSYQPDGPRVVESIQHHLQEE